MPGLAAGQLARLDRTRYDSGCASFWLISFFEGVGWVWLARLEICGWARRHSLAGAEPSPLAAKFAS